MSKAEFRQGILLIEPKADIGSIDSLFAELRVGEGRTIAITAVPPKLRDLLQREAGVTAAATASGPGSPAVGKGQGGQRCSASVRGG